MKNMEPLFSLENADLKTLFTPAWVKETTVTHSSHSLEEASKEAPERRYKNSPGVRGRRDRKNHPSLFNKKEDHVAVKRVLALHGWKIEFLPEPQSVDDIAKQIKSDGKAYPLFELARLILQKPERYTLRFVKISTRENLSSRLYQCLVDQGLWLSEKELVSHVLKNYCDRYYVTEKIEVEPPKGLYTSLAVCGMSQTILGPSNHHEYQTKMRQLYLKRFAHLPFEVFKSRIMILRDAAKIEEWKKAESTSEIFIPVAPLQEAQSLKISSLAALEAHFKQEHAPSLSAEINEEVFLSGVSGIQCSDPLIKSAIEQALQELKRFPLPLSHLLGQELGACGLQIFKAHENIVYVSLARPRYVSEERPLSPSLMVLLNTLKSHQKSSRTEQWQAIVASRPLQVEENKDQHESAVAKDLKWLIHEGYVMNYASRGFEIAKKPKTQSL